MKILHVTKKYPNAIGGDATCVFNLEKEQGKNGHRAFILTTNCPEIIGGSNLYKFGIHDTSDNWDKISLKRILSLVFLLGRSFLVIKKIRPDIIHSHSADLGFLVSMWAKIFGIPVVNTCHGVTFPYKFLDKSKRLGEWLFLKFGFFNKIITVDANSTDCFRAYGLKNYEYIHMLGVDSDAFIKIRNSISLSDKRKHMRAIFVGRIGPLKKLDYLIMTAKRLSEQLEDSEFWIIGDGPCRENLVKLAYELGVEKQVKFFNTVTDKESLIKMYCLSDIFVLPSIWEGFPLVILEAWAAGLAVIATDVGGITRLCKDKENALIIPPMDVGSLANAIITLVNDDKLREKISINGMNLVKEKYQWRSIEDKLEDIYKSLVESPRTCRGSPTEAKISFTNLHPEG